MDQGAHGNLRKEQATAPGLRGHQPLVRRTLAPKNQSPLFAGWGGQEDASHLSDGRLAFWCARRCLICQWPIVRHNASPRSDSNGPPTSVGARNCLGDWQSGASAASTGGDVSCVGGSKSAPSSGPGIAGVPALTAGKRCILAVLKVVSIGDNNKVSDLAFSCLARWLTPGSCSSARRLSFRRTRCPSPPTLKSSKTTFGPSPPISIVPRVRRRQSRRLQQHYQQWQQQQPPRQQQQKRPRFVQLKFSTNLNIDSEDNGSAPINFLTSNKVNEPDDDNKQVYRHALFQRAPPNDDVLTRFISRARRFIS